MAISTTSGHLGRELKAPSRLGNSGDDSVFTQAELMRLVHSCCTFQPQTEHDLIQIMRWAERARVDAALLQMMLDGKVGGCWIDETNDIMVGRIA